MGAVAGALVFAVLQTEGNRSTREGEPDPSITADGDLLSDDSTRLAQYDRQVSALKMENESLLRQISAMDPSAALPHPNLRTVNERIAEQNAILQKRMRVEDEGDRKRLLAAGYAPDQIDWLVNRSRELQKERREAETELRRRGLPVDAAKEMAYYYDRDIELRYEIGDDGYEKYLRALDRPADIPVRFVSPGSIADSVGIKPGDRIIKYDSKRVFNLGELDGMTMGKTGGSHIVEVQRDGQMLQFEVPAGPVGILSDIPALRTPR